jgi:hypothetical protein
MHKTCFSNHLVAIIKLVTNYNNLLVLVNKSISYYFVTVYIVIGAKTSEYFEVRNGHLDIVF